MQKKDFQKNYSLIIRTLYKMPKVLTFKQQVKKNYKILEDAPEDFVKSFGHIVGNFKMIVWGDSGNGKSNFIMQFMKVLLGYGKVLYLSLEEGHERSMQLKMSQYFNEEDGRWLRIADHTMSYRELKVLLRKRTSAKFVIIDSLQYWNISYEDYKELKKEFPTKSFIFISHANGRNVHGNVASRIKYDAGIKVFVEGYVAFVKTSRYGGEKKPFIIWEDGARQYWGKKYRSVVQGIKTKPKAKPKKIVEPTKTEDNDI